MPHTEEYLAEVSKKQLFLLDMREAITAEIKALKSLYELSDSEERRSVMDSLIHATSSLEDIGIVIEIGKRILAGEEWAEEEF